MNGLIGKALKGFGTGMAQVGEITLRDRAETARAERLAQLKAERGGATPAELQTFDALTQGMTPEEIDNARRIKLGMNPRAPSAAAKNVTIEGADGRKRQGIFDPVKQSFMVFTDDGWSPAGPGDTIIDGEGNRVSSDSAGTMISRSPEDTAAATAHSAASSTPPKDMYLEEPGNPRAGAAPIPGGPVDKERKDEDQKKQDRAAQRAVYADIVTQDIDRALTAIDEGVVPRTGLVGSMVAKIPAETPQFDLASLLETIRANVGFDRLQQMREASPTGGALGQVSNFENQLLQATVGNLAQAQSKAQLKQNLTRVREIYDRIINEGITPTEAADLGYVPKRPKKGDVIQGYRFLGTEKDNPNDRSLWEKVR